MRLELMINGELGNMNFYINYSDFVETPGSTLQSH